VEVLSDSVLRTLIPDSSFQAFKKAATEGHPLDPNIADQIANAMKEWYLLFFSLRCSFSCNESQTC
jgi:glutamine synthetase type III